LTSSVSGQQSGTQKKWKYAVVPPEEVLMVIAYQPESGLQFEEVKYLAGVDGGNSPSFLVRNKGTKPIRSFTVGGPWGTETWSEEFTKKLFMPGERTVPDGDDAEIVPLSKELREKLKLNGSMKAIGVLMVVRVEYADGSVYSAEPAYEALQKFSDELGELKDNVKSQ
jgi:hypothetical protein